MQIVSTTLSPSNFEKLYKIHNTVHGISKFGTPNYSFTCLFLIEMWCGCCVWLAQHAACSTMHAALHCMCPKLLLRCI